MTVAENIALVAGYPRRAGLIDWHGARMAAADLLARMGGGIAPDARVGSLPAAGKAVVAIARALAVRADLLVLDEPTAALPEADVARLLDVLRRLRAEGMGLIYVTHRLDEVFRIADRVTVLRDGRRTASTATSETTPAALVQAIIGRRLRDAAPPQYLTGVGTMHAGKHLDQRRLAGAVLAEQRVHLAGAERRLHRVEREGTAEPLGHAANLQQRRRFRHAGRRYRATPHSCR